MERKEIIERVNNIVNDVLGVETDAIKETSSFEQDLGADSLDIVDMLIKIEKEFEITINDEEAEKVETVGEVYDIVQRKMA